MFSSPRNFIFNPRVSRRWRVKTFIRFIDGKRGMEVEGTLNVEASSLPKIEGNSLPKEAGTLASNVFLNLLLLET